MAGSRLEKLGTIFTRVTGLIKSGAMKIEDRPIWYDVYRAFPPESEPHYAKPAQHINVPNIFYPEDEFRADFHKKARSNLPLIDLRDTQKPNATKIAVDMVLADQSLSTDQVIDTLKKNNVLQVYTPQKFNVPKNIGGVNKLDIVSELNQQTKETNKGETKDHSS